MKLVSIRIASLGLMAALASSSMASLVSYSQNFEGLNIASPSALGDDGWKIFGNVFDGGGNYIYGYGPFAAPNGGNGFSAIATGEGGPAQGAQYINTFSDYNNGDHGIGRIIEANIFQEQVVSAGDYGKTFEFKFDYKASSQFGPVLPSRTKAFIKVLNPGAGFSLVAFPTHETTAASTTDWATSTLSVTIDNTWAGHILQFGFLNTSTNYATTGMYYDNINFGEAVPEPATLSVLALSVVGVVSRRRRK